MNMAVQTEVSVHGVCDSIALQSNLNNTTVVSIAAALKLKGESRRSEPM